MRRSTERKETDARRQSMLASALTAPLRAALADPDIIEIIANPDGAVWFDRLGTGLARAADPIDAASRERLIRLVASAVGESVDRSAPIVSAELPGALERFEGLMPPVAEAPCFAIRKRALAIRSLDDYVREGAIAAAAAAGLRSALAERRNILIAGGASSGKTTFANALLADDALARDRLVILEDARELQCAAANSVMLKTQRDGACLATLLRSALRLRPDRLIVGEVRGGEALALLKAWNTGHPGGLATLHANSGAAALTRLEQLIGEATTIVPRALIAEAVDIVVFLSRRSGARRVEETLCVRGLDDCGFYRLEPLVQPKLALVHGLVPDFAPDLAHEGAFDAVRTQID